MRIADPVTLNRDKKLESVLTAIMPRFVVDGLFNAMHMVEQLDTPGPARMALLELDAGPTVAVVYHEVSNLLEILAPLDDMIQAALAEVVTVLRIPRPSIEWAREGVSVSWLYKPAAVDTLDAKGPAPSFIPDFAQVRTHFWRVAASESAVQGPLTASKSITLTLLLMRLMHSAGDIAPIGDTGIRVIEMPDTILFEDGAEAAPLAVYYQISEDGSTASILDVKELPAIRVHVAKGTLASAIETARFAESGKSNLEPDLGEKGLTSR